MENEKDLTLDELIIKHGEEFNDNINKIIESDKLFNNELVYEDDTILPGQKLQMPSSDDITLNADKAQENLIQTAAMLKLQKEREEFQKLSDDEKIKDYICQAQYYRETNDFFKKYGYEMSGKQKRFTKRAIETAWKKGKFKITPEQREDILFELSKASNQNNGNQTQQSNSNATHIADLNSLIFRN